MRTIDIKEIRNGNVNTYSVKDESPRGCHTASREEIQIGDKVVIDNHFVTVVEGESMSDLEYQLRAVREELENIYNGEAVNDDGEEIGFYDWAAEQLDHEYLIASDKSYRSVKVYVTLGGPTVWIDTDRREICGAWGSERAALWLPCEICDQIDDVYSEFYGCC